MRLSAHISPWKSVFPCPAAQRGNRASHGEGAWPWDGDSQLARGGVGSSG